MEKGLQIDDGELAAHQEAIIKVADGQNHRHQIVME